MPVEKKPEGYLGIKQACFKCLREKLKDEKSVGGWAVYCFYVTHYRFAQYYCVVNLQLIVLDVF